MFTSRSSHSSRNGHSNSWPYPSRQYISRRESSPNRNVPPKFISEITPKGFPFERRIWSSWPGVALRINFVPTGNLKKAVDFLPVFSRYGNISEIRIKKSAFFERTQSSANASKKRNVLGVEITFVPPPPFPFWREWHDKNHNFTFVDVRPPYRYFGSVSLASEMRHNVMIRDVFLAGEVTFGQMIHEDTFVEEYHNTDNVRLHFNFGHRLFQIEFTHSFPRRGHDTIESAIFKVEHEMKLLSFLVENENSRKPVLWICAKMPGTVWRKSTNAVRDEDEETYRDHNYWCRTPLIRPSWTVGDKKIPCGVLIKHSDPSVVNTGKWRIYRIDLDFSQIEDPELYNARKLGFKQAMRLLGNFSDNTLSPIRNVVRSPRVGRLDFRKLSFEQIYMIECLISKDLLNEYNLEQDFVDEIASIHETKSIQILQMMHDRGRRIWKPTDYIREKKKQTLSIAGVLTFQSQTSIPPHCVLTRRVMVTPTRIILEPPSIETTNRITRFYKREIDRFLRVTFLDEAGHLRGKEDSTFDRLFTRVYQVLQSELMVGGRQYEFLAASSSQLKEHGCWYYNSVEDRTAKDIRSWMGDFRHIKVPARYVSRLGQAFSSTFDITKVDHIVTIEDKKSADGKYCFSDGVGKIGKTILIHCHQTMDDDTEKPVALQFRMGGSKGVLVYWPDVDDNTVYVRPSQTKFTSTHNTLEVIKGSVFKTAYLSRQIITVLNTTLGITDETLLDMQREEEKKVCKIDYDRNAALRFLKQDIDVFSPATTMLRQAIECGFLDRGDLVVTNIMRLLKAWRLRDIKSKARIPIYDGAYLLGVMDETGILEENEIFVKIQRRGQESEVINQVCILCRSPCIHPGDIRIVRAVSGPNYVARLGHLRNVIVFPSKGHRDLASQCGGGDLDGDDYTVIWDPRLIPRQPAYEPMNYKAIGDAAGVSEITIKTIIRFIVQYFKGNNLGMIANNGLAIADFSPQGSLDSKCIKLAELHAMAVDFAKTGKRAIFPRDLYAKSYPDFMENDKKEMHISKRALGKMYRNIVLTPFEPEKESSMLDNRVCLVSEDGVDQDELLRGNGWDSEVIRWIPLARELKLEYDQEVIRLQNKYEIATEYEVFTAVVVTAEREMQKNRGAQGPPSRLVERREWDVREEIARVFGCVKTGIREKIINKVLGDEALFGAEQQQRSVKTGSWAADVDEIDPDPSIPVLPKGKGVAKLSSQQIKALSPFVIAMYRVTYGPKEIYGVDAKGLLNNDSEWDPNVDGSNGQQRYTFPWIFYDVLTHMIVERSLMGYGSMGAVDRHAMQEDGIEVANKVGYEIDDQISMQTNSRQTMMKSNGVLSVMHQGELGKLYGEDVSARVLAPDMMANQFPVLNLDGVLPKEELEGEELVF